MNDIQDASNVTYWHTFVYNATILRYNKSVSIDCGFNWAFLRFSSKCQNSLYADINMNMRFTPQFTEIKVLLMTNLYVDPFQRLFNAVNNVAVQKLLAGVIIFCWFI